MVESNPFAKLLSDKKTSNRNNSNILITFSLSLYRKIDRIDLGGTKPIEWIRNSEALFNVINAPTPNWNWMNRINEFCLNSNKYALHENQKKREPYTKGNVCGRIENHFYLGFFFCDLDFRSICLTDFGQGKHLSISLMVGGHLFCYLPSIVVGGQFYWNHSNLNGSTQLLLFFCSHLKLMLRYVKNAFAKHFVTPFGCDSNYIQLIGFFVNQNVQHTISGSEW